MRNILFILALTFLCCVALSQEAKAQVISAISDVSYYAPTNEIYAYAQVYPDYSSQAYYCATVTAEIYKNGVYETGMQGNNYCSSWCGSTRCGGWARAETYLPYDPNAEYIIEAYHEIDIELIRDESGGEIGYYDYYGFRWYYLHDTSWYPNYNDFIGVDTPDFTSLTNILLGATHSIFSEGATSGPPHHLKVHDDIVREAIAREGVTDPCGQLERLITFQVVDQAGRNAGRTAVGETFPGRIISSCTGNEVMPSPCSTFSRGRFTGHYTTRSGRFTDNLRVGCPAATDDCGFTTDPLLWVACSGNYFATRTTLARFAYDVRKRRITINGRSTLWPRGTEFFP